LKLSIIISNRNDIVLLNVTLNSLLEAIKSVNYECEIVVVDNSDESIWALINRTFPAFLAHSGIRFFHESDFCFTKARMIAARESAGEFIFCIDSHVLIGNRTLGRSIEFMHDHPDIGFGHPPMRWAKDGPGQLRQEMHPTKEGSPYARLLNTGTLDHDKKIFWKFMPWICRREWYLDTLQGYGSHAEHSISWGGAELLQQIKGWMLGYENWYIHTDPVIHIGPYNREVYKTGQTVRRTYESSGNFPVGFGILLALYILAGEEEGLRQVRLAKKRLKIIHKLDIEHFWPKAIELGKAEHEWLAERQKYSFPELMKNRPWSI